MKHTSLVSIPSLIIVILLSIIGCDSSTTVKSALTEEKHIAILQLGTHDVIDAVVAGIRERAKELYGDRVIITVYNPNFDMNALSMVAKQMTASDANILVSVTTPATGLTISANLGTKPLVFTFVSDPASIGYTRTGSLSNTTGLSDQVDYNKVLDLIRTILPKSNTIGYLLSKNESNAVTIHKGFISAAATKGFEIQTAVIGSSADIRLASETLAPKVDAFLFGGDNTVMSGIDALIIAAHSKDKPVFSCDELSVARGAIGAYSVDYHEMGRKTANTCAAVFGGADPAHIPLDIMTGTRLILNRKAANALNIDLPPFAISVASKIYD